ncbi:MAG: hypothetical protein JKY56_15530, partial [Kofleriaceae bacterium]|nr:hypothetical protein [Kofleriaceae bacterium]
MRRPLLIGGAVLGGFLLTSLLALWLFYGRIGAWVIRDKVLPKLEARLGQSLEVGEIDVERGRVILRDVSLVGKEGAEESLLHIDEVLVTYDYGASWLGEVIVHDVSVEGLVVRAYRNADGSSNFQALVDTLGRRRDATRSKNGTGSDSLRPQSILVMSGEIHLIDRERGAEMHLLGLSAHALAKEGSIASVRFESAVVQPGSGPRLTLGESILRVDPRDALATARFDVSNGAVKLWQGMTLTGISGQVAPGDD